MGKYCTCKSEIEQVLNYISHRAKLKRKKRVNHKIAQKWSLYYDLITKSRKITHLACEKPLKCLKAFCNDFNGICIYRYALCNENMICIFKSIMI